MPSTGDLIPYLLISSVLNALSGLVTTSGMLRLYLRYDTENNSIIQGLQRISKPGLRHYASKDLVPRVLRGLGIAIISTPQGVMTDKAARKAGIGGEVLCKIW